MAEVNGQLQKLKDVGNQRLQELRRFNEDAYKAVMWLRENRDSFRGLIHEPMMLTVSTHFIPRSILIVLVLHGG